MTDTILTRIKPEQKLSHYAKEISDKRLNQRPRCKQRGIKLAALQAAGYLTLAAFAKCSCKHGTWLIARGNKAEAEVNS